MLAFPDPFISVTKLHAFSKNLAVQLKIDLIFTLTKLLYMINHRSFPKILSIIG